jgi:protein TonB
MLNNSLSVNTYAYGRKGMSRGQLTFVGVVVLLHILLALALHYGLALEFAKKIKKPVEAVLLDDAKPDIPPPPPPVPKPANLPPQPTTVPQVEIPVQDPPPSSNSVTATATNAAPAPAKDSAPTAPAAPAPQGVRVAAAVSSTHCEKPEYPAASRRNEEEGVVRLKFLIGTDGKVMQSQIEKSSGFKRLDEAARDALSRCQFRPGTVDGQPEVSWATINYKWQLE